MVILAWDFRQFGMGNPTDKFGGEVGDVNDGMRLRENLLDADQTLLELDRSIAELSGRGEHVQHLIVIRKAVMQIRGRITNQLKQAGLL